ncbi:rhodanese-like domain-containing protein [Catenovulum sp. 2E275]|uniref:rhodanese-like domain-containing protein n=1 Tax=Catenovulum sp. 2E275 TaxID=2980497 RepID=UPI0021CF1658|nr:rhodanese-like domain-containing protein [Catenovulum sp. 2E275]MCU4676713.1 rhodanese-like domain-containing protein [Catenovulum sp. 2E275]
MSTHSSAFLQLVDQARQNIKEIDIETMLAMKASGESFVLVDVREQDEWAAGHLPDAVYIGKGVIERDIQAKYPDPQTTLVLYCGGGFRSALAADNLVKMGYQNAINMDGGYRRWTDLGHPVVKG